MNKKQVNISSNLDLRFLAFTQEVKKYFNGDDEWLYIKHPDLEYKSPIHVIKHENGLDKVKQVFQKDIDF